MNFDSDRVRCGRAAGGAAGRAALVPLLLLAAALAAAPELAAQEPGTIVAADPRVQGRTYILGDTGDTIPYALFVPSDYDPARKWPLMVGLHGLGRPFDWIMGYDSIIQFAQRDGFIMVSPLGYHSRGWYGSQGTGIPASIPAAEREALPENLGELSERDVMNVLAIVRGEFNIDDDRIYLWGHSMGGAGTYHLAAQHPDLWAGLAVAAPASPRVERLEEIRHIPILVLHGDEDRTVPIETSRRYVARMRELGMQHVYIEFQGGDHSLFMLRNPENLSKVFSFFNVVRRNQRPAVTAAEVEPRR